MSGIKLRLMCILWPDDSPNEHAFLVEIDNDKVVSELKKIIKGEHPRRLAGLDASDLVLWKCSIPADENLNQTLNTVRLNASDPGLEHLPATSQLSKHFMTGLPLDIIHILVEVPDQDIRLISSNIKDLERLRTYLWGEDRIITVNTAGKSHSTLDLKLFNFKLNARPDELLLVREEYISAYNTILNNTLFQPSTQWRRSATLVTGQQGIGKTLFLLYILSRRLQVKEPVALQISPQKFALFDEHGVSLHSSDDGRVPVGAWALSDSSGGHQGLCSAFEHPPGHIIHTSSPASHRWKGWVKRLSAVRYIMDIWSLEEVRTLLTIRSLDVQHGEALFRKFGPSPRIIIDIILMPTQEVQYLSDVRAGAITLAGQFSEAFFDIQRLDFGSDTSKIFTVRPDKSNTAVPVLSIPTPFLSSTLGLAVSSQTAAQQHTFFRMLSGHPSLRTAAGWLFEHYGHVHFSDPNSISQAYLPNDPNPHVIPTTRRMISGTTKLKAIQKPYDFYWRPREPDFEGVDGIIRVGESVWALQFTIGTTHRPATNGLTQVNALMTQKTKVKWHLVMVGQEQQEAELLAKSQKQGLEGRWKTVPVYACELPLGKFTEENKQRLRNNMDEDNNPEDQEVDSDVVIN